MTNRFELFTTLIFKVYRSIRKIKTKEMSEYNLKSTHVSCLYYLYNANSLTAKELCDLCIEDKAMISRSIDYLESNGFLMCDSNLVKRYKSPLYLTEKGKKVGADISKKIEKILLKASEGLSDENRVIFYQSLSLISNNLEKISNEKGEINVN